MQNSSIENSSGLSKRGQWLALIAALLGWMFDGLEMGLFPLVARPALRDLLHTQDDGTITRWFAVITAIFLIGAATGGVLFGWLGDRIGRVRAMTLSIFTYAIFSGVCGLANEAWQVAGLRFIASLGMGGEWSLGVALVMEIWPDRSRAWLAGVMGSVANFGYAFIAIVGLGLNEIIGDLGQFLIRIGMSTSTVEHLVGRDHSGWRIMMIFGAFPALLTFLIRMFVPESQRWTHEKNSGATSHWETRDLLGVLIGATAACGMIALLIIDIPWPFRIAGCLLAFVVVLLGYLYPIVRYFQRQSLINGVPDANRRRDNAITLKRMLIAAAISGVALLGTWGTTQQVPTWVGGLPGGDNPNARAYSQMFGAMGAIIGCVVAALAGDLFGRRKTYCGMCVLAMVAILAMFNLNKEYGTPLLIWALVSGTMSASFYGWIPLYLPELFKTRVRATGQGFGFNFGRVLAAIGVMQLPVIRSEFHVSLGEACSAISFVYIIGMILIWFAPETKGKPLPED